MTVICYHCKRTVRIAPGAYHVIGIDLSEKPPVSLYACGDCWRENPQLLTPSLPVADLPIDAPEMAQLSLIGV